MSDDRKHELFINTGVQEFEVQLSDADVQAQTGVEPLRLAAELGTDWRRATHCRFAKVRTDRKGTTFHFRVAVDTTAGEPSRGFAPIKDANHEICDLSIDLQTPSDLSDRSLRVCQIRLLGTHNLGQPVPVALILDVGNSRTCALVIEDGGGVHPFGIDSIRPIHLGGSQAPDVSVFPSIVEFTPPECRQNSSVIEYSVASRGTVIDSLLAFLKYHPYLKARFHLWPEEVFGSNPITSVGFAAEIIRSTRAHSSPSQTGLSSPKRYLWDEEQLDHSWCYLASTSDESLQKIRGQFLQFLALDDSDAVLANYPKMEAVARADPSRPNYPRRALMVFFLYALLRESFRVTNSPDHRKSSSSPQRSRQIKHLVLTYPSAMSRQEVARFVLQAKKALGIFGQLCQPQAPEVSLHVDLDEGVASHVAFLSADLLYGKNRSSPFRVGALDIGGGTLDLAIAQYELSKTVGERRCRVELVDGAYLGGDDLVKRLVSDVIIAKLDSLAEQGRLPSLAEQDRLSDLFQGTAGGALLAQRIRLIRSCLLPLAFECLRRLEIGEEAWELAIADYCDHNVLVELGRFLVVNGEEREVLNWKLKTAAKDVNTILREVLGPTLARFKRLLGEWNVVYVLLAGKLSSLPEVRRLLSEGSVNFTTIEVGKEECLRRSYQEVFGPVPVDPKTSVAIGAALDWCGKVGRSPTAERVVVDYSGVRRDFIWGFINPATGEFSEGPTKKRILSWDDNTAVVSLYGTQFLGRQLSEAGNAGVIVPRYRIRASGTARVVIRRRFDEDLGEEVLEIVNDPEISQGEAELRPQSKLDGVYWLDSGKLWGA